MNATKELSHAERNARGWLDTIIELVSILDEGGKYEGETLDAEQVQERIWEGPLSVEVRTDWYTPGTENGKAAEYRILLSTGGPALQLVGALSEHGEPETATLQHQDWGTPWTNYWTSAEEESALLRYAQQFYFEG